MKKRAGRSITRKRRRSPTNYQERLKIYARLILPAQRAETTEKLHHARTQYIRSSKRRTYPVHSPHAKTVLVRRRTPPLVPPGRIMRRSPILGSKGRTPGRRNPCTLRDIRKSVLFTKKLIGHAGSSPGRKGTYRRTVDSSASCK